MRFLEKWMSKQYISHRNSFFHFIFNPHRAGNISYAISEQSGAASWKPEGKRLNGVEVKSVVSRKVNLYNASKMLSTFYNLIKLLVVCEINTLPFSRCVTVQQQRGTGPGEWGKFCGFSHRSTLAILQENGAIPSETGTRVENFGRC